MDTISGFSKLSKKEKINWLASQMPNDRYDQVATIDRFWHHVSDEQKVFDEFSENTITNFYLPYGIAPNFLLNGHLYAIPMVIEESSVVAAASKSAKYWLDRGGFKAIVHSTIKTGQIHFMWSGQANKLSTFFLEIEDQLMNETSPLCFNMIKRGGGLLKIELVDCTEQLDNYYQLKASFETCDAMGANFINTVLEELARLLKVKAGEYSSFNEEEKKIEIVMSILSNYTPDCLVECWVECPVEQLTEMDGLTPTEFVQKFVQAINIARVDKERAVTHNKGIFNGVDSVVLATGNDFRAIEACGHAFASRDGRYRSLSEASVVDGIFRFGLKLPLSVGTVGGLTALHPLAKVSLDLLGNPNAKELMQIIAAVGLAQNFSAVRSLVTTGIQKGHMKMHLLNIFKQLEATEEQILAGKVYFADRVVSYSAVRDFLGQKSH